LIKTATKNEAELVIASNVHPDEYRDNASQYGIQAIELNDNDWLNTSQQNYYWIIEYDSAWDNADSWFKCLRPLRELITHSKN